MPAAAGALNSLSNRSLAYKNWDEQSIRAACRAVHEEGLSQRRAAEEYGIPRSTLGDHYRGKVLLGAKCGSPKYLTEYEEKELLRFLMKCASIGYPKSRKCVISLVQRLCNAKGLRVTVTHGWWESFCKRHPHEVSLRIPAKVSMARAKANDPEVISNYFDMYEKVVVDYDIIDKPIQIFNIDETGYPWIIGPPKSHVKEELRILIT